MAAEEIKQEGRKLSDIIRAYEDKLLIIVFYAEWCKPCRRLLDWVLPSVSSLVGKEVVICPINVGESQNYHASREYKAKDVPTSLFFRKEREISRISGLAKVEDFFHKIKCHQKKESTS